MRKNNQRRIFLPTYSVFGRLLGSKCVSLIFIKTEMSPKTKQILQNRLWQARQRVRLRQKQVAALVNQQTANQISQYENGTRVPNLETALRLSIIYRVPVRSLFFGLYKNLQEELKDNLSVTGDEQTVRDLNEFCALEEFLEKPDLTKEEFKKAKKHSLAMVNKITGIHAQGKYLTD